MEVQGSVSVDRRGEARIKVCIAARDLEKLDGRTGTRPFRDCIALQELLSLPVQVRKAHQGRNCVWVSRPRVQTFVA